MLSPMDAHSIEGKTPDIRVKYYPGPFDPPFEIQVDSFRHDGGRALVLLAWYDRYRKTGQVARFEGSYEGAFCAWYVPNPQ